LKKLFTFAVLAASSSMAFANNQISDLGHGAYSAKYVEIHFSAPDNRLGYCDVQMREASYPNTVWARSSSRNEPGSPFDKRQWADFNVPYDFQGQTKQIKITCDTQTGSVTKIHNLPAPPTIEFTIAGKYDGTEGYDITGGAYVEGYATGTYCVAQPARSLVGVELFKQDLGNKGGYYSSYIQLNDYLADADFYHGYAQARVECFGKGGSTVKMLEIRKGNNQDLEVEQQTIYWN
jgi:hypothetical protein